MLSLSANSVMIEYKIPTALQLVMNSIELPHSWYNPIASLFERPQRSSRLAFLAQRASLRFGWGQPWNHIFASVLLIDLNVNNFTRILQWSDWFIFERSSLAGTWLISMLAHITFKDCLRTYVSYVPKNLCDSGLSQELFYHLDTLAQGCIQVHFISKSNIHQDGACAIEAVSGLALDGQFCDIALNEHSWRLSWSMVLKDVNETATLPYQWIKRQKYTWELISTASYARPQSHNFVAEYFPSNMSYAVPPIHATLADAPNRCKISDIITTTNENLTHTIYGHPMIIPNVVSEPTSIHKEPSTIDTAPLYDHRNISQALHYCRKDHLMTPGKMLMQYPGTRVHRISGMWWKITFDPVPIKNNCYNLNEHLSVHKQKRKIFQLSGVPLLY